MQISQIVNTKRQPVPVKKVSLGKSLTVREVSKELTAQYEEHILLDIQEPTIIENMVIATSSRTSFRIRIQEYKTDGNIVYGELQYDGTGSLGLTPENMMVHGSSFFDFLEYDLSHGRYKLALKSHLTFPEGVRISFINDYTSTINYSTLITGRYYD